MIDFVAAHAGALTLIVAAFVAAGVLSATWEAISLWLLSAWHSLPVVGGIAWLARRQKARPASHAATSESSAVLALCSSYARFIRVLNRTDYDNYMNYLRKAGDLGRQPFPPYLRVVIFSMILIEAAGLAYVLAGWTLPGASEFAQRIAALGIGFLIAVILVFFTHWAGLEIDQANRYRRDRNEWIAAGRLGPLYGPDLSLNDAQNVDDNEPAFRQRATRGHGKITYVLTAITLIMVVAVGSGAAFVRGQVLEQEIVQESATQARAMQRFAMSLPETATNPMVAADQRTMQEEISIKRRGGWGTLIILVIIFFFLQLLGMFFGYRHSFNGRLSKDAYRALRADRFSSYRELLQYYDRVADIAQSKVERLQQLIEQQHRDGLGGPLRLAPYSFRDYLFSREAQRRDKPLGADPDASAHEGPQPAPGAPAPLPFTGKGQPATVQQPAFESLPLNPPEELASAVAKEAFAAPRKSETRVSATASARAQLELAERLERQRAAERASRSRTGAARKGSAQTESEGS